MTHMNKVATTFGILVLVLIGHRSNAQEAFTETLPSGLRIQALRVGMQFYNPDLFRSEAPVYQIKATFRATGYGNPTSGLSTARHYGLSQENLIEFRPYEIPSITTDTAWLCDLTKDRVNEALKGLKNLPEPERDAIGKFDPAFYSIEILIQPEGGIVFEDPDQEESTRQAASGNASAPLDIVEDRIKVLHDLRGGICFPSSPAILAE